MAKPSSLPGPAQVTAFIQQLELQFASAVEVLRQIILAADNEIGEHIKWNSPAFYFTGQMQPFDPKEYRRDIVVMNLQKGKLMLVFPTGDRIVDTTGILEGDYADGRRVIRFKDLADVQSRANDLQIVIRDWMAKIDR
jgi:hypothetical protein